MKNRGAISIALGVFVGALSAVSAVAAGTTPGGMPKKYVGLLFDVINTTPANILANADQFAEHAPYLDGVAIALRDVPAVAPDGTIVVSQHNSIMHPTHRWTRDAIKDQLPILKAIAQKPHLKESFLLFWQTPGHKSIRLDWRDDKAWANYAENMANVAWLAKEAGLKGLMLDPEEYKLSLQYIHTGDDPPFEECAKLARQRGREVFSRVFKEFPDAVIWSLWFFSRFSWWLEKGGRQRNPLNYCDDSGELSQYYYNGMIDAMPPEALAVDGTEHYSGSSLDNAYIYDYVNESTGAMAFVAPENMKKFRSQFLYSNTHYLDMYKLTASPSSRWYHGPVNGSRLEHMRLNFEQSLRVATKYIWLYGEGSGKLFNWRDGHYGKTKTWEEVAPGMTETIMMVKDPIGLAQRRKSELKKKGGLVNLAKDWKPIVFENQREEREIFIPKRCTEKITGLKPGTKYQISVGCSISSAEENPDRIYATHVRYYWMKDGKRVSDKPFEIPLPKGGLPPKSRFLDATAVVAVPEGVDSIEVEAYASVKVGETARFRNLQLNDMLEPVNPEKAIPGKWVYDEQKGTLSDGNWVFAVQVDKKNRTLTARGDNDKTVGKGVVDFTNVKTDTGYTVEKLGRLCNLPALTGVVAPNVWRFVDGGLSGSKNVKYLKMDSLSLPRWATSEFSRRRALVFVAGYRDRLVKRGFSNNIHRGKSRQMRPQDPMVVKGLKPGELYSVGLSMKRRGGGVVFTNVRFRGNGRDIETFVPMLTMNQPRKDNLWRSGEIVVRVPEGADEMYLDISAEVFFKVGYYEFKDFTVYKIGEPLPVWPEEALREKTYGRK